MAVIAMTREMGSLGRDIALGLAEELGLEVIQHQLVEHVAERMHLRESSVNRFLEGTAGLLERWGVDENDLSLFTTEEILAVAEREDVLIRGWGATYVLRGVAHIPCIRVCAPVRARALTLMKRIGIDDYDIALKEIRRNDAAHARTMSHLFNTDYKDPLEYDLTINTAKTTVDTGIELVKRLVESESYQPTEASRAELSHMRIEADVRAALRDHETTRNAPPSFGVDYDHETDVVRISGVSVDERFKIEAEKIVAAVPGVKGVENEMLVVRPYTVGP